MLSKVLRNQNAILSVRSAMFSNWSAVTAAPADPILGLNEAFKKETNPKKQLLGMGVYRCDKGKPFILDCVRQAEKKILELDMDHEYAGIQGIDSFVAKSLTLAYGEDNKQLKEGRIAAAQAISGTGSLRLGLQFLADWYPHKDAEILVPNPTWPLHRGLVEVVGRKWVNYRYYDPTTKGLDFNGFAEDLKNAKNNSIVLLHVCAHNPTGVDPTPAQWENILDIVKSKGHFCAFDSAYQGFASGDLERDAYSLRLFAKNLDNIMLFQSFAKNFGLYGERAGCMSVITANPAEKEVVMSRIKVLARALYSNPPIHGARIVDIILGDKHLTKLWHDDLKMMSGRMMQMRTGLHRNLKELGSEHNWNHLVDQIGMFAYTGLNKAQVDELREKSAIYMTADGRISIAGLNTGNLHYIAEAFHNVTKGKKF
jgi:aspartate aminotransferase